MLLDTTRPMFAPILTSLSKPEQLHVCVENQSSSVRENSRLKDHLCVFFRRLPLLSL